MFEEFRSYLSYCYEISNDGHCAIVHCQNAQSMSAITDPNIQLFAVSGSALHGGVLIKVCFYIQMQ